MPANLNFFIMLLAHGINFEPIYDEVTGIPALEPHGSSNLRAGNIFRTPCMLPVPQGDGSDVIVVDNVQRH